MSEELKNVQACGEQNTEDTSVVSTMEWVHDRKYNPYLPPKSNFKPEEKEYLNNIYRVFRLSEKGFPRLRLYKNALTYYNDLGGVYFVVENDIKPKEIETALENGELELKVETFLGKKKFDFTSFIGSNNTIEGFDLIKRGHYKKELSKSFFIFKDREENKYVIQIDLAKFLMELGFAYTGKAIISDKFEKAFFIFRNNKGESFYIGSPIIHKGEESVLSSKKLLAKLNSMI